MFLVRDVLLIEVVHVDLFLAVGGAQQLEEVALELVAEVVDVLAGVFADDEHLPDVGFGLAVHLEAVFVAALLLAHLAVPAQALEAFGFELVVEVFRATDFCFRHVGGGVACGTDVVRSGGRQALEVQSVN